MRLDGTIKTYMLRASDLAEAVEADIKTGEMISLGTVLALSKYIESEARLKKLIETCYSNDPDPNAN